MHQPPGCSFLKLPEQLSRPWFASRQTRLSRSAGAIILVFHVALRAWLRSVTLALSGRHSAPSTPAHRRSDLCPAIFSPPQ